MAVWVLWHTGPCAHVFSFIYKSWYEECCSDITYSGQQYIYAFYRSFSSVAKFLCFRCKNGFITSRGKIVIHLKNMVFLRLLVLDEYSFTWQFKSHKAQKHKTCFTKVTVNFPSLVKMGSYGIHAMGSYGICLRSPHKCFNIFVIIFYVAHCGVIWREWFNWIWSILLIVNFKLKQKTVP